MKIKKEYSVLFNAISAVISAIEENMEKDKKILNLLKEAQIIAEDLTISDDEDN